MISLEKMSWFFPLSLYTTQLVLLGDSGVGKSCIVLRFVRGQFDPASKVFVADSFFMCGVHGALASSSIISFSIVL